MFDNCCVCCGHEFDRKALTRDHVVPKSKGGTWRIYNIQPLCKKCNGLKGDKTIDYRESKIARQCRVAAMKKYPILRRFIVSWADPHHSLGT